MNTTDKGGDKKKNIEKNFKVIRHEFEIKTLSVIQKNSFKPGIFHGSKPYIFRTLLLIFLRNIKFSILGLYKYCDKTNAIDIQYLLLIFEKESNFITQSFHIHILQ